MSITQKTAPFFLRRPVFYTYNAGYILGAGYENGGWNGQFTTPGVNRMNNHYFYEK